MRSNSMALVLSPASTIPACALPGPMRSLPVIVSTNRPVSETGVPAGIPLSEKSSSTVVCGRQIPKDDPEFEYNVPRGTLYAASYPPHVCVGSAIVVSNSAAVVQ